MDIHLLVLLGIAAAVAVIQHVDGARILTVFPSVGKSHFAVGEALSVGLAKAGHHVTLISPFAYKSDLANLEAVQLTGAIEAAEVLLKTLNSVEKLNLPAPVMLPMLVMQAYEMSNGTLLHPNVRKLMDERSYDLVIVEVFATEALIGLGQHFGAPVAVLSTFGASMWTTDLTGTPSPPSFVPHAFSQFSERMTFVQRTLNMLLTVYETIVHKCISLPYQRSVYRQAFPHARTTFEQALSNVSLVLLNSHFSINAPRPFLPNMIEVGGMHVKHETQTLPANLQTFLDTAPAAGVIYFSLGSFVKSAFMSAAHRDAFVKVFATLPQRVVWKFEEDLPGRTDNVLIDKWLPQRDILAHPNVRLFISHGGLLGTTEAAYNGVPVIGMPLFGDQIRNIQGAVNDGWAVRLDYANVTESSLRWALETALGDPSFTAAAKDVSRRYRDQPMTPLETAVFWCEYVIRHGGAPHWRSASMDLNFVQYHSLDVIALLTIIAAFCCWLIYWSIRCCIRRRRKSVRVSGGNANKKRK